MAAASSSGLKYDVFINFRGEDTRRGFVSHLYKALRQKPINTFIDAKELRKGECLSELLIAIRESRLSIVVFSQNYASSTWCLKELVEILECHHTKNQIVLPIFYEVDPSDIYQVKGSFAEAFAKHERHSKTNVTEVHSWRSALARASDLSGRDSQKFKDDAKLIEEIVEYVIGRLIPISPTPSKDDGLECTRYDRLMAASSSSSGLRWKYDVFINFKGQDVRTGFVSHLYRALHQKTIKTFIDSEELTRGNPITNILTAIMESRLSIVVFSQNYASSTWCLKELVQILECKQTKNQIVLPVFYKVDTSDVRQVKGSFAEAFAEHERRSNVKEVQSWRSALASATNLSGWDSKNYKFNLFTITHTCY
ncbi:hypothetical protein C1H46_036216 [Malus baccata]|uniref:TIR domain-containing protein n=1 Tax=Malus baccata TaxID=106549 RepID=A0A540KVF8_MALBA|nr:hypothetical protein C1H46_036216 [Malus baccata]